MSTPHLSQRGELTIVIWAAFRRYSMYCVDIQRLCFPAFQHRGQHQVTPHRLMQRLRRTVAPSHKLPPFFPLLSPCNTCIHICACKTTAVMLWWMDGRKRLNAIRLFYSHLKWRYYGGLPLGLPSCSLYETIIANVMPPDKVYVWACVCGGSIKCKPA